MANERFTRDHEWIRAEGGIGTVGISHHAQEQLGDIVYVELPEVGRKAASDVYAPVAGEVVEVNAALAGDQGQPGLVNEDAEGRAWFFKIRIADAAELDQLMDRAAYEAFLKQTE